MNAIATPDASWRPPPKLYRIGEVVKHTGFSRQTIHNYTTMGLIRELERTEGGHRLYGEDVFRALAIIKKLKREKTLAEIRDLLEAEGLVDSTGPADAPSADSTL